MADKKIKEIEWAGSDERRVSYLPFFVYGTLRPGGANYARYLGETTETEEPAILRHAMLVTDGLYPYLIVAQDLAGPDDQVQGVLATVQPERYLETLQRLDWLEDYKPLSPLSLYVRISQHVETMAGPVEAWMYVAGPWVLRNARAGRLPKVAGGAWPALGRE